MNYQSKIIKYKLKKNKIIQKINIMLQDKITENENYLANVMNDCKINSIESKYCIIVTGILGCGKTTLVEHIIKSKKIQNLKYIKITNISNDIMIINDLFINNDNSIIIEIDLLYVNELLKKINSNSNVNYCLWKLEPSNKIIYINKIANKILGLIDSKINVNEFANFIDLIDNSIVPNKNISKKFVLHNIKKISSQNNKLLSNSDFDFIDEITQILINQSNVYNIAKCDFINYNFIKI